MKKTGLITALIAAALLLVSCGDDIQVTTEATTAPSAINSPEQSSSPSENAVSLRDILTQIKDSVTLPDMMDYSEGDIKNQLGITTDDYSEVLCYVSNDGCYPDFIFIAKAKDNSAVDKVESKLGNYRSAKIVEWKDYLTDVPERYETIERSQVAKSGDYIYLVISTEDADITDIIKEKLG